jgi:hypothetical protein
MGNRYEVSGGVTRHTDLTDKEVNGVIDHADGSVTGTKIADAPNGVSTSKINDGSVTDIKLASGVGLNDGQIAKLPVASQGQVLTRGATAWEAQAPSGGGFNSRVSVGLSATQSIPVTTFTKVRFNSINFDGNAEFDPTTNYRWTVKAAGYYLISIRLKWNGSEAGKAYSLYLYKNGTSEESTGMTSPAANPFEQVIVTLLSLNANDYIEVYAYNGGTVSQYIAGSTNGSYLYGHRLS